MKEAKDIQAHLSVVSDTDIISVNARKRLNDIQKKFPNLEIIVGAKTDDDKPVSLDLAEMDHSRTTIFDAATESIMGKRIDRMSKAPSFPLPMVTGFIGFLLGVGACFLAYTL